MTPTQAQIEGAIRSVIIALGGVSGSFGYLTGVDWIALAGALATVGGLAWSLWSNSRNQLLNQTAALPVVKQIAVHSSKVADEIPSPKVVPIN